MIVKPFFCDTFIFNNDGVVKISGYLNNVNIEEFKKSLNSFPCTKKYSFIEDSRINYGVNDIYFDIIITFRKSFAKSEVYKLWQEELKKTSGKHNYYMIWVEKFIELTTIYLSS